MANSGTSQGAQGSNEDQLRKVVHGAFMSIPLTPYPIDEWVETKMKLREVVQLHVDVISLVDELQQLKIKTEHQFKSWCRRVGDAEVGRAHPLQQQLIFYLGVLCVDRGECDWWGGGGRQ